MTKTRTVAVLLYDGVNALDVTGPVEAFASVRIDHDAPAYRFMFWSLDGLVVRSESGLRLLADSALPRARGADLLLVPGGAGIREPARLGLVAAWLRRQHTRFANIACVCTGAYALAESGLCDGSELATHWRFARELARRYPRVLVRDDALYLRRGRFYSSGGITAGIDLAMTLIEQHHGSRAAIAVARELVVYLRRTGSQAQFSEPLRMQAEAPDGLSETCVWAAAHLSADLSVDALAARSHLSPRQFSRRFLTAMGAPPASFVRRLRLDAARQALAQGASLERVAETCGFRTADGLGRAFERAFRITPAKYRDRFRSLEG